MMNNTPRSAVDFTISITPEIESSDVTYPSVFSTRSPWSFLLQDNRDVISTIARKSRDRNKQKGRSPRSKTKSPRRHKQRWNSRNPLDRHDRRRVQSSSPIRPFIFGFDPAIDRHLWTMWRIALTGRIVTDIMERKRNPGVDTTPKFVRPLKRPPAGLAESIYISGQTRQAAYRLMNTGHCPDNAILTQDFIFFGIPRVCLNKRTQCMY
jgi:hypothetical protein